MCFDDCRLAKTHTRISAHWYSWQTWLISMNCSQKTFHFFSVSNGLTSILSGIVITLQKSYKTIFAGYFEKLQILARDVFETFQRRHGMGIIFEICSRALKDITNDIFFEMFLRRLKDVTKETSFLRCIWDVLKTSQKVISLEMFLRSLWDVSLNGALIEISQRNLMPSGMMKVIQILSKMYYML